MSREAMKQALEALESKYIVNCGAWRVQQDQAIAALRQALVDADDTSQERVDEIVKTEHDKQIEIALAYQRGWDAALAQQEPVAWLKTWSDGSLSVLKTKSPSFADHELEPLYTTPPKREWVGLTDDAVFELADTNLYDGGKNFGVLVFAKAVEQSLKEKNYG